MYHVIIAELDRDFRGSIVNSVSWESFGFTLTGEAGSYREALLLARCLKPDVVLSSVHMPDMDVREFASVLRKAHPAIKLVLFSIDGEPGDAFSLPVHGVYDYLPGPLSREDMMERLHILCERLDGEHRQGGGHRQPDAAGRLLMQKNSFMSALVRGQLPADYISHKARHYGMRLSADAFLLMCIDIDRSSVTGARSGYLDRLLQYVADVASAISAKYVGSECFIHDESVALLLADSAESIRQYGRAIAFEIHRKIRRYGGFTITIGVSRPFSSLSDTKTAYFDSIEALHFRLINGADRVYFFEDYKTCGENRFSPDEIHGARFVYLLQSGEKEGLSAFITELFTGLRQAEAPLGCYQACMMKLTMLLFDAVKTRDTGAVNIAGHVRCMADLHKLESTDELVKLLQNICFEVMDKLDERRRDRAGILAEYVSNYILANYGDSGISLKLLGEELDIDAGYLGDIYKKAAGEGFQKTLNRIRMEKAHELICATTHSVRDVAAAVGFTDAHYFSSCFKKYYKVLPTTLRGMQNKRF